LAIPLANSASTIAPVFGKPARKVIELLVELGLVTKIKGYPFRGPTTIRPTAKLRQYLPLGDIRWSALRMDNAAQVVLLKEQSDLGLDADEHDEAMSPARHHAPAKLMRWLCAVTRQMQAINAFILSAPIECRGTAMAHVAERPGAAMASLVTLHHRTLRRTFNRSYDEGGRLFGGFWQTMPRDDRFAHIRIDGESVALVDYGQLFLRLAYAKSNKAPPDGDLYDLTGHDASLANWKALRDARKKLINALFFARSPLKQWPGKTIRDIAEMRRAYPPGTKPREAIQAIKQHHAPIVPFFEHGLGLRFMRTESDLITAVTIALFNRGVAALPIHDAVVVEKRHAEAARSMMEQQAKALTGAIIPAEIQFAPNSLCSIAV
jgi:hypothetical protein